MSSWHYWVIGYYNVFYECVLIINASISTKYTWKLVCKIHHSSFVNLNAEVHKVQFLFIKRNNTNTVHVNVFHDSNFTDGDVYKCCIYKWFISE